MFGIGMESVKMYGAIALASIVGIFLFIFKMRGMKIDNLESKMTNMVTAAKASQAKAKKAVKIKKAEKELSSIVEDGELEKRDTDPYIVDMIKQSKQHPTAKFESGL